MYYSEHLKEKPEHAGTLIDRSYLLMQFGQYDSAMQDAEKLISIRYIKGYEIKGRALLGKL